MHPVRLVGWLLFSVMMINFIFMYFKMDEVVLLTREKEQNTKQIEEMKKEIDKLTNMFKNIKWEKDVHETTSANFKREAERLRDILEQKEGLLRSQQQETLSVRKEKDNLVEALSELQRKTTDASTQKDGLIEQINLLKEEKYSQSSSLLKAIEELEQGKQSCQKMVADVQDENQEISQQNKDLEEIIAKEGLQHSNHSIRPAWVSTQEPPYLKAVLLTQIV